MEWLSPLLALAGVLAGVVVGARLAARTGEAAKLLEIRIERYANLIRQVDEFNRVFVSLLTLLGAQAQATFSSEDEWNEEIGKTVRSINEIINRANDSAAELSLFTSTGVSEASKEIVKTWIQMLMSVLELSGDPARFTESAKAGHEAALMHLQRSLVDVMRRDLAVDRVSWWKGLQSKLGRLRGRRRAQAQAKLTTSSHPKREGE